MARLPFSFAGSSNDPARQKAKESEKGKRVPRDFKNYYHILAVSRKASPQQIEKAYGVLLEKFGPHVNISEYDPQFQIAMLKEINEAYQVLIDPARRRVHDAALAMYMGKEDVRVLPKNITGEP